MSTTANPGLTALSGGTAAPAQHEAALAPKPYWNPYVAGILLGVTLFLAFFTMGRGLGASGPLMRLTAAAYEAVNAEFAHSLAYFSDYFGGEWPVLYNYALYQILGVLLGGYASAAVARRQRLMVERGPHIDVRGRLIYAFAGGFIMAWGARIARGCTSGQVLTGSASLAIGSLIMFVMFFGGAFATAYFVRKQWI